MQTYFDDLKEYLKEEQEKHIDEFKIDALLVVSNSTEMMQNEILSTIRSIAGIVRVNIEPAIRRSHYYITRCNLKVNTEVYGLQPLEVILQLIRQQILDIAGVRRFTFISKPEKF